MAESFHEIIEPSDPLLEGFWLPLTGARSRMMSG